MIRNFKASDIEEIIKIWNGAFSAHPIDTAFFVKNVLFDVNFSAEGFFVYEDFGGMIYPVGFILAATTETQY